MSNDRQSRAILRGSGAHKAQNMPSAEVINKLFDELITKNNVQPEKRQQLLSIPLEKKWEFVSKHYKPEAQDAKPPTKNKKPKKEKQKDTADMVAVEADALDSYQPGIFSPQDHINALRQDVSAHILEQLDLAFIHESPEWIKGFVDLGGASLLTEILGAVLSNPSQAHESLFERLIDSLKDLMKFEEGLKAIVQTDNFVDYFVSSLEFVGDSSKAQIIKVLSALCLINFEFTSLF
eukprot:TRINITY_DN10265_c0_g1_i1.p1 TRINITY_DN10265_c0_g1~~TRINITY_DN10265_c0_g1_i1.p1  ORF type:complete len:236 (+),score=45.73 TRINITY_DN10265_c0_g1_i1:89-796(+)